MSQVEPPPHLKWTDEDLAVAVREAWSDGYAYALRQAAERVDELDVVWRPILRPSPEERIAARRTLFEMCAAEIQAELDARRREAAR